MPLPLAQPRLWFRDRPEPESPRYIVFSAFRLQGVLEVPALVRSLGEILHRHQSLRARFLEVDGQPELRLAPAEVFPLPIEDLRGLSPAEQASELQRIALVEGRPPFSLVKGP